MSESQSQAVAAGQPRELEPAELALALERLRAEQNLGAGLAAGAAAAAGGAAAWAVITVFTHYQIGWMAVGVGFLVGLAVRHFGKGIDKVFGFVGSGMALLGCLAGNLLAACGMVAREQQLNFLDILAGLNPDLIGELLTVTFSPMDLLFYGIAVYEGYKLSFRQLTEAEIARRVTGAAP